MNPWTYTTTNISTDNNITLARLDNLEGQLMSTITVSAGQIDIAYNAIDDMRKKNQELEEKIQDLTKTLARLSTRVNNLIAEKQIKESIKV